MCGRYALGVRMAFVQQRMREQGMPVDEAPEDDEVRETYNFAPGNMGAVYRADDGPYRGHGDPEEQDGTDNPEQQSLARADPLHKKEPTYKLQSMKWGLIPFWTKRQPDYGSLMRTINCRDDSLIDDKGMWTSMKRKKRCVVVCQGFYEWLKKGPGGKEKVPHYTKRKDGDLMYFAGLWDSVSYQESEEKLYTYTIITTSSNPYLKFLHDRMPVILEPGSDAMKTWLDPNKTTWSKELQSILKPYEGELECYAVPKEVGKVGNNSPDFIVPVSSKENKSNIANFFANAKKKKGEPQIKTENEDTKAPENDPSLLEQKIMKDKDKQRTTQDDEWSEDNAPVPVPGVKRERPLEDPGDISGEDIKKQKIYTAATPSPKAHKLATAPKSSEISTGRKTRSATHNITPSKKAIEKKSTDGSQRITNFFRK
ncbi:hypothetical protein ASPWEDRAFT_33808 [Aspergillus wentii DTO 134E9]|uniref:DUF159 domain protein n=1 Tax=Aspergillus wentii DTO 134E9 TaxID=1073089 RepID=A0A1L9RZQ5_ASPWE|nr:uncharacterized protein ASPWEDRAFT_33808 [Aspergillus wentii DTO 134E9]OJJ40420.1 hypothetical protein ASPWEDRAFT_33808 [Aspergillus wentii DTO 134E9]